MTEVDHSGMGASYLRSHPETPIYHPTGAPCRSCDAPVLDPDPRHVPEDDALWDPQAAAWVPRPSVLWALLVGAFAGAVLGFLVAVSVVHATSRSVSAPPVPAQGRTGAPHVLGALDPGNGSQTAASSEASLSRLPRPSGVPFLPSAESLARTSQSVAGLASWCAPTPLHCQSWGGDAHLAAVPSFRYGDRPYTVIVSTATRSTTVRVVSYCACGTHVIDLSPSAFAELAPLDRGVIAVVIERVAVGRATPPPTDTVP